MIETGNMNGTEDKTSDWIERKKDKKGVKTKDKNKARTKDKSDKIKTINQSKEEEVLNNITDNNREAEFNLIIETNQEIIPGGIKDDCLNAGRMILVRDW